jgi:3-hydroxymyristoyl/3-hydroxydecanoyl-(acyl carrier protein) dehydratase
MLRSPLCTIALAAQSEPVQTFVRIQIRDDQKDASNFNTSSMTSAARTYDGSALQSLLPHRYPLLLVDRIDVVVPGQHVVGIRALSAVDWWVQPGASQMPFSLVLEALAQTSGALVPDLADDAPGTIAYFMGADHVRLRRFAQCGERLRLDVWLMRWRRGLCRVKGTATVDGAVVLTAELTTMVRGTA